LIDKREKKMMQALGRQILVEFYDCNTEILSNLQEIEKHMLESCRIANATIVTHTFHEFSPYGVSGAVIIAESHVAIHTWPEHNYAAVDIFTCGETISPWVIHDYLKENFQSKNTSSMELRRGLFDMGDKKLLFKPDDTEMFCSNSK
jgi:S-adenosylmethionine decarboxylase proenzyme